MGSLSNPNVQVLTSYNLGQFRAMDAASGDQAFTGVGFRPTVLIVFAWKADVFALSWGYCSSNRVSICAYRKGSQDLIDVDGSSTDICHLENAGGTQTAIVKSFDADGFTLTWTKGGAPAGGNASVYVLALR